MDPNLLFWKKQRQDFQSRVRIWLDILDPTFLVSSDAEIQKAHASLASGGKLSEKDGYLSLSSVHADSGAVLPLVFRPAALVPMTAPVVAAAFLPHARVSHALFWQLVLQSYNAGFSYANRNSSSEQHKTMPSKQLLMMAGMISCATVAGALPQVFINRLNIRSTAIKTFLRSFLPFPISVALAFFSVLTVRSKELETGIQVFDSYGNPVGISKVAGRKAVAETALSRALLFGTTAVVPDSLVFLLQRLRVIQKSSFRATPFRAVSIIAVWSFMVPVSFSRFPQLGKIKKEYVEEHLQAAAYSNLLYYHKGL